MRHARENPTAWPGLETLAAAIGTSTAQSRRGLRRLEALGLIETKTRKHSNGSQTSSEYRINWLKLLDLAEANPETNLEGYQPDPSNCRPPGDKLSSPRSNCHPHPKRT